MQYPSNWDQVESEYNKNYDPYGVACEECCDEEMDLCVCDKKECS